MCKSAPICKCHQRAGQRSADIYARDIFTQDPAHPCLGLIRQRQGPNCKHRYVVWCTLILESLRIAKNWNLHSFIFIAQFSLLFLLPFSWLYDHRTSEEFLLFLLGPEQPAIFWEANEWDRWEADYSLVKYLFCLLVFEKTFWGKTAQSTLLYLECMIQFLNSHILCHFRCKLLCSMPKVIHRSQQSKVGETAKQANLYSRPQKKYWSTTERKG